MNNQINKLLDRTSVRSFKKQPIEPEKLELLKKVINASPTSLNGQQFSAIIIEDDITKGKIAERNGKQLWINEVPLLVIFVADINRVRQAQIDMNNMDLPVLDSPEMLLTGAVDCGIAATNLLNAAISMDMGGCYLGLIRGSIDILAKELNLSGQCTPIVGMAIGYPSKYNDIKPKVNKVYHNQYDIATVQGDLKNYNSIMEEYYTKRGETTKRGPKNWSINTTLSYRNYYAPEFIVNLARQFKIKYFK